MATSSKVRWKLDELRARAVESIDNRIAAKSADLERFGSQDAVAEQQRAWRERQVAAIERLFQQRFDLDDVTLSRFRIEPLPERDDYQRQRAERELRLLQDRRDQMMAKSAALVADEDGNIALTKTQLAEFFDL